MLAAVVPSAVSPDIIWWHLVFVLSLCFIQMNILSYLNKSLSCISSCKICSAIYKMANNLTRVRIIGFDDFTTLLALLFRFMIRVPGKTPYFFWCWECRLRASNENESLWNKIIIIVIIKRWIYIVPLYSYILSQLSTCLQWITLLISTTFSLNHIIIIIIIMFKQLYIISFTDIFPHLGNVVHVSSSVFTCPLDDVSRLLILSSKSLISCFDSWASFSYSSSKSAFCTLWKQQT